MVVMVSACAGRVDAQVPAGELVQGSPAGPAKSPWVEPDFPFFSSVVYVPPANRAFPGDNLTPRGLVLNLGHDCWVSFDTELLRVSAAWRGFWITPRALAPGSYDDGRTKPPQSQKPAPEPVGQLWVTNAIYPGWQRGNSVRFDDPRPPAPSREEVGRGPLSAAEGRFQAVRLVEGGVVLEYSVGEVRIQEWITATIRDKSPVVERHINVGPSTGRLTLVVGTLRGDATLALAASDPHGLVRILPATNGVSAIEILPRAQAVDICAAIAPQGPAPSVTTQPIPRQPAARRWHTEVITEASKSAEPVPYVVETIGVPINNPWGRRVRPGDIQFLPDGTGVLVTIDGDVWLAAGLEQSRVRWRRFASGLHEPFTAAIRDNQIFVFDRNGIWRLVDSDGNGEADVHELFSNAFAQTADMREFASTIRLGPQGEFVIAKGGQQSVTLGKHNGSVLRISRDGRESEVLGYGFRQPSIAVNPRTGMVTSSDQEGQYIPSTPLHVVRDGQFYGFLAPFLPREKYPAPIAEPLTWIPHTNLASAMSQVWLFGARMGPLSDSLVQIAFNRPELHLVLFNGRASRPQAAVTSVTKSFAFPPLNGSVNPRDGQLYLAGFQVLGWGNVNNTEAGLARVRFTGEPVTTPREVAAMDKGLLLRFDVPLEPRLATDPSSYSLASWHYRRTYQYGSPQLKEDGTPGQDFLSASAAYLSRDGKSVFVAVPGLKPAQQLRIGWALVTVNGARLQENAVLTPYVLTRFDPAAEGFEDITIDLTPRPAPTPSPGSVTAIEGARLSQLLGCAACHFEGENSRWAARIGPSWHGLYGREQKVVAGGEKITVLADEAYLRESILEPAAKLVSGYETGEAAMPSFAGVVSEDQLQALVLYLKSLK